MDREYYIGIEDLAANALIELLEEDPAKRFVSYKMIEQYGAEVVKILSEGQEKGILIMSRERTYDMYRNYSEFFEESTRNETLGIRLKDEKNVKDLIQTFRGYLATDVLIAFINQASVSVLGVK